MTIRELKLLLSELDDDLHVFVRGYEDGLDDVKCLGKNHPILNVALNTNTEYNWKGEHDNFDEDEFEDYKDYKIVKGIKL
jgi:hypothetical protein